MATNSNMSGSMGVMADDGKYYATGGSGKKFVYNPATGNIGVTKNGETHYVTPTDAMYQKTLDAANADTGYNWTKSYVGDLTAAADTAAKNNNAVLSTLTGAKYDYNALLDKALEVVGNIVKMQQQNINAAAETANTGAYNTYIKASDPYGMMAENMAKLGLGDSGYAESSKIGLSNAYLGALNANELARQQQLNELEIAKMQAEADTYKNKADAAASFAEKIAKYEYDIGEQIYKAQKNLADAAEKERNKYL